MDFGVLIFPKPDRTAADTKFAENLGFSHAWFPDSHMIWGDAFVCMALAASATEKIKLGTGVTVASSRIAPVTVHSIASINQLAPGRVILGFGTGHTGRRVMGLPPVKQATFREEVRLISDLLRDGEGIYNTEAVSRRIRYLHRDRKFINLDNRIPLYVAGNGPKTLALAGEYGDGVLTTGIVDVERMATVRNSIQAGAAVARRNVESMPIVSMTHICVLRPGEKLDSPRVRAMTGPWVMVHFHAIASGFAGTRYLSPEARAVYQSYEQYVANMKRPAAERYLDLHVGHCTYVLPEEERFVTPETVAATTIVGTSEEVIDRLRSLEGAGLSQVFINPPMDGFNEALEDISRNVIDRM
jgi:alkanesulfonate monooxygenase SsuD/methylene tetrahydromethanopterin reductase-like flavin-dependent oxidoreductase (luciferase family)